MAKQRKQVKATDQTTVVAYIRASTDKQGDSLVVQREKISAYASLYNLNVVEFVVDDGVSGKTLERQGLSYALSMIKSGAVDGLIVAKLDRLTRSVKDLGFLIENHFDAGAALLSVSEQIDTRTAGGRLVLNILASVSQWEREVIVERTTNALQSKKARNELVGAVPFGKKLVIENGVKRLVNRDFEQRILSIAIELRDAGLTLRGIAVELQKRGFLSRAGKVFAATQISRMVA